ncbi:MAG: EthD domain-containing protein [Dehalococcoidales bacterium]|jgi:uncharacterized protein (TIGR02118 family)
MIKTIAVAHRKADMTHEEFIRYWHEEHATLVKKIWPGLRKYVQNEIIVGDGQKREADGIVEMWYDNLDAMKKAMAWVQTKEGKPIRDDADKFTDLKHVGGGFWVVEENVVKDEISKK